MLIVAKAIIPTSTEKLQTHNIIAYQCCFKKPTFYQDNVGLSFTAKYQCWSQFIEKEA
jgi:hypothetical protein